MAYTRFPSQPEQHYGARFDEHQFAGRGRAFRNSGIDYNQLHNRMHILRVADLRKSRRFGTPSWAITDQGLRETIVTYLEARFYVKDRSGTLRERLARASAAGEKYAKVMERQCKKWISEYHALANKNFSDLPPKRYKKLFFAALKGEPLEKRVRRADLCVANLDSLSFTNARAAELTLAVAYYSHRLGWNSPSIAEELNLKAPAVRQILHRLNRTARRMAQAA